MGDLPGLAGLQAIAQQYNQIKNVFENDALEQALIDQYSPFSAASLVRVTNYTNHSTP